jgi:hypothetical protein
MLGAHMRALVAENNPFSSYVKFEGEFSRCGGNGCPTGNELEYRGTAGQASN